MSSSDADYRNELNSDITEVKNSYKASKKKMKIFDTVKEDKPL